MKLAIVQSTGNPQVDKIFAGVFGQLHDGIFHVAEELKKIHLFTLLTPEALKAQGVDLSETLFELEVPDEVIAGVKATLLQGLKASWMKAYTDAPIQAGLAKVALDSEAAMVRSAVEQAIQEYGVGPVPAPIMQRAFSSANVHANYGDGDGEDEYSDVITGVFIDAKRLATRANMNGIEWVVADQDGLVFDTLPERADSGEIVDYASGVVQVELQVQGTEGQGPVVATCILNLPPAILNRLDCVSSARLSACEFHSDNRQVMEPQADEAGGPTPEGDASAGPTVEGDDQAGPGQVPTA